MSISTISPATDELEQMLHDLADCSGEVIMPFFRSSLSIDEKHDKGYFDPVTEADRKAEQVMRALVEQRYGDHGIIGEEFGSKNEEAAHCWIFDPIDGTRAFIIGAPTWGTLIGLTHDGEPVLGMMNQPFTRERYWGGANGAFWQEPGKDAQRLSTSTVTDLDAAIVSTTAPEHFATPSDWQAFQNLSQETRMNRYGYDCYAYCLLAMGRLDLVAESGLAIYDIAPLVPIVRASGGVVTSWDGGDPTKGGAILASANQPLHDKALAVLNQERGRE